jgi:hypothetical protein
MPLYRWERIGAIWERIVFACGWAARGLSSPPVLPHLQRSDSWGIRRPKASFHPVLGPYAETSRKTFAYDCRSGKPGGVTSGPVFGPKGLHSLAAQGWSRHGGKAYPGYGIVLGAFPERDAQFQDAV